MNPGNGIETVPQGFQKFGFLPFITMNPGNGIETRTISLTPYGMELSLQWIPATGLKPPVIQAEYTCHTSFHYNESRPRDWNLFQAHKCTQISDKVTLHKLEF